MSRSRLSAGGKPAVLRAGGRLAAAAADLLYPRVCVGCGRDGAFLCKDCTAGLPRLAGPACALCAQPLGIPGNPLGRSRLCRACSESPLRLNGAVAACRMEGTAREAVHALKYRGFRALAGPLGALLAEAARGAGLRVDGVVPVPLHARRLRERGYNQAELLARAAAREMGAPALDVLIRARATSPQVGADRSARSANVAGAFGARGWVEGLSLALVDDVCTTGATLQAAADALRAAGAREVWGLVLAREA